MLNKLLGWCLFLPRRCLKFLPTGLRLWKSYYTWQAYMHWQMNLIQQEWDVFRDSWASIYHHNSTICYCHKHTLQKIYCVFMIRTYHFYFVLFHSSTQAKVKEMSNVLHQMKSTVIASWKGNTQVSRADRCLALQTGGGGGITDKAAHESKRI